MPNARRVKISLTYNNTNVTQDIAPFLLSFSYTDNAHGQADDLSIQLEDRGRRFTTPKLFIKKGTVIQAAFSVQDWDPGKPDLTLPCGTFEVDEIELHGAPDSVTFKGVSVPISGSIRSEKKSKAWENCNLKTVAQEIATSAKLNLLYTAPLNPKWKRKDQNEESNLEFLKKTCEDYGFCLKVTDKQVVIYDAAEYEKKPSVKKIVRGSADVLSHTFKSKAEGVYSACHVKYTDPTKKTTVEYTYKAVDVKGISRTLEVNERVESLEEAEILARKKLRDTNMGQVTGSLNLRGDLTLVAGCNVDVSGWGEFDGKFAIAKATHGSSSSGYTTQIDIYKVLEGY